MDSLWHILSRLSFSIDCLIYYYYSTLKTYHTSWALID